MTKRCRKRFSVADLAFELELDESVQRDRYRRPALDVHPVLADVARQDAGEPCGAALVLPRETRRQRDGSALGCPLVLRIGALRRLRGGPDMVHGERLQVWLCANPCIKERALCSRVKRQVRRTV